MPERIWVFLERGAEGIGEVSLQALSLGAELAEKRGGPLEGVLIGGSPEVPTSYPGPLSRVYHLIGEDLEVYTASAFGAALEDLVRKMWPAVMIFPSTIQGEDLASWLGAGLGVAVLLGAREVRAGPDGLVATRVEFDGKVAVDYALEGSPVILTLEEGAFSVPKGTAGQTEIVKVTTSPSAVEAPLRVLRTEVAAREVNLREARVIVAVGAGVGSREGFEQVQQLAQLLGGEIGATRAAVDAGWVPYGRQIGQTGVKVKPELYLACGISGAAQHRVGMLNSGTIVSINMDPQAPIFRVSHYCVEADLRVVIPKLVGLLRG